MSSPTTHSSPLLIDEAWVFRPLRSIVENPDTAPDDALVATGPNGHVMTREHFEQIVAAMRRGFDVLAPDAIEAANRQADEDQKRLQSGGKFYG